MALAGAGDGGHGAQRFLDAGGAEVVCKVRERRQRLKEIPVNGRKLCLLGTGPLDLGGRANACCHRARANTPATLSGPRTEQVLSSRPRGDTGRATLRLRLLLAELSRAKPAWEARVFGAAADASVLGAAPVAGGAPVPHSAAAASGSSAVATH